jgi:hypothetical protein
MHNLKQEKAVEGYEYITQLPLQYKIELLQTSLEFFEHLFDERNQLCVTCRAGSQDPLYEGIGRLAGDLKESDYSEITPMFKGTVFEQILLDLKITWGRARIMCLKPHMCMSMHPDMGWRYHVALKTNPNSFLFFRDTQQAYHIPVDGYIYKMDTTKWHTAFNAGKKNRYHFVIADGDCFDSYVAY